MLKRNHLIHIIICSALAMMAGQNFMIAMNLSSPVHWGVTAFSTLTMLLNTLCGPCKTKKKDESEK